MAQRSFQMKVWILMTQRNSMIPKSSMIQREFQLGVWTLILQKATVIPPSSMVLFWTLLWSTLLCNARWWVIGESAVIMTPTHGHTSVFQRHISHNISISHVSHNISFSLTKKSTKCSVFSNSINKLSFHSVVFLGSKEKMTEEITFQKTIFLEWAYPVVTAVKRHCTD